MNQLLAALRKSVGTVIAGVSLLAVGANAVAAGLSGAIFTTDVTGLFVNGNVYEHDDDVYLNGGPKPNAPCTAAGLPDGYYYFQVTDPSGKVLLSTDALTNREVQVADGVIVGPGVAGSHFFKDTGQCGSRTVQVCPFNPSPNGAKSTRCDDEGERLRRGLRSQQEQDRQLQGHGLYGGLPTPRRWRLGTSRPSRQPTDCRRARIPQ